MHSIEKDFWITDHNQMNTNIYSVTNRKAVLGHDKNRILHVIEGGQENSYPNAGKKGH